MTKYEGLLNDSGIDQEEGFISYEMGLSYSSTPDNFKLRVMGIRSSMDIAREDMEKSIGDFTRKTNNKSSEDETE